MRDHTELRCPHKLHAILQDYSSVIEVKCSSKLCGAGQGTVVLHRFSAENGELLETAKFANPDKGGK